MSEVRTTWGFSAAALGAAWYSDAFAERQKARQFENHACRVAAAGPLPNEVTVRLVDRGLPAIDGREFEWVTTL